MSEVREVEKENSALSIMQIMVEKYSLRNKIDFKDAMDKFTSSSTYQCLFEFETGLWKEGPDYLLDLFEKELLKNSN